MARPDCFTTRCRTTTGVPLVDDSAHAIHTDAARVQAKSFLRPFTILFGSSGLVSIPMLHEATYGPLTKPRNNDRSNQQGNAAN